MISACRLFKQKNCELLRQLAADKYFVCILPSHLPKALILYHHCGITCSTCWLVSRQSKRPFGSISLTEDLGKLFLGDGLAHTIRRAE